MFSLVPKKSKKFLETEEPEKVERSMDAILKAEENLLKYRQIMEEKSLREQDTGITDYLIIHPQSICPDPNATLQYRKEYNCQAQQLYNKDKIITINVNSKVQSYLLNKLQPKAVYRVSVRACVAELENSCGSAISIWFQTQANK